MDTNPTVVFTGPKKVVLEDRPVPELAADGLMVETTRSLISTGTELTILSGEFPKKSAWADYAKYPFLAGYSNVGRVTKVGSQVDPKLVGKLAANTHPHARYVAGPASEFIEVPEGVDEELAAFFTLAQVAMNGIRRGRVTWGESVVIYGMGILGQLTSRFLRIAGAGRIFCVDVADSRLALAGEGAITINPSKQNVAEVVGEHTAGRMADVVFELTGKQDIIPSEFQALHKEGRMVMLSSPRGATQFDFHDLCNSPSFEIIGAHALSHPPVETWATPWTHRRHAELFFDFIATGRIDMAGLISHREPYTEAPKMYHMLLEDRSRAMGVILKWD